MIPTLVLRGAALTALYAICLSAGSAAAQESSDINWGALTPRPNISISLGANHVSGHYDGLESVSGNAPMACVETDFWGAATRYAGEFGGIRIAAFAGACHNFEKVSDPIGVGIDGKIDVNTILGTGVRISVPLPTPWLAQAGVRRASLYGLYGEVGVSTTYMNIVASPFESGRGWVNGVFYGGGVELQGFGIVPNIDAAAQSLYISYRHYENEDKGISGSGGRRDVGTNFDVVMGGSRIKF
jgi:hypothetical protein